MSVNPYASPDNSGDAPKQRLLRSSVKILVALAIGGVLVALLLPARRSAREAARRNSCINNLKMIGLALQNYEDAYGALPPAYTVDVNDKPLHSWRTLILPFMEEKLLYESIDLTKPWNDPVNASAFNADVYAYACPSSDVPGHHTTYMAVVASGGCFRPTEPRRLADITDGPSKTLMVIEAPINKAVHWMCPQDADEQVVQEFGPNAKLAHSGGVTCVLFVDGHVGTIAPAELPADLLPAMISIAGNDEVTLD